MRLTASLAAVAALMLSAFSPSAVVADPSSSSTGTDTTAYSSSATAYSSSATAFSSSAAMMSSSTAAAAAAAVSSSAAMMSSTGAAPMASSSMPPPPPGQDGRPMPRGPMTTNYVVSVGRRIGFGNATFNPMCAQGTPSPGVTPNGFFFNGWDRPVITASVGDMLTFTINPIQWVEGLVFAISSGDPKDNSPADTKNKMVMGAFLGVVNGTNQTMFSWNLTSTPPGSYFYFGVGPDNVCMGNVIRILKDPAWPIISINTAARTAAANPPNCAQQGSTPGAFILNGQERPALTFFSGQNVTFQGKFDGNSTGIGATHLFALILEPVGGNSSAMVVQGTPRGITGQNWFTWMIPPTWTGTVFYGCIVDNHLCMGNKIDVMDKPPAPQPPTSPVPPTTVPATTVAPTTMASTASVAATTASTATTASVAPSPTGATPSTVTPKPYVVTFTIKLNADSTTMLGSGTAVTDFKNKIIAIFVAKYKVKASQVSIEFVNVEASAPSTTLQLLNWARARAGFSPLANKNGEAKVTMVPDSSNAAVDLVAVGNQILTDSTAATSDFKTQMATAGATVTGAVAGTTAVPTTAPTTTCSTCGAGALTVSMLTLALAMVLALLAPSAL